MYLLFLCLLKILSKKELFVYNLIAFGKKQLHLFLRQSLEGIVLWN